MFICVTYPVNIIRDIVRFRSDRSSNAILFFWHLVVLGAAVFNYLKLHKYLMLIYDEAITRSNSLRRARLGAVELHVINDHHFNIISSNDIFRSNMRVDRNSQLALPLTQHEPNGFR